MVPPSLERQAETHTRNLIHLATKHFGCRIAMPEVRFDLRGKAAGMAIFHTRGKQVIRYNRRMLAENGRGFIEQTVPHEVAHLAARVLFGCGIRPHGPEWRSIMDVFGAEPTRCHNFPTLQESRRRMRYFPYRCACRTHQLSAIRHNRSRAGMIYLCRRCGTPLQHNLAGLITAG